MATLLKTEGRDLDKLFAQRRSIGFHLPPSKRALAAPTAGRGLLRAYAPLKRSGDSVASSMRFVGHGAVFDSRTFIGYRDWGFYEEIAPTAFDGVLRNDTRFLVNHNPDLLLARTLSGTMRQSVDDEGLVCDADMPDTQLGRDTAVMIDRGDFSQMSFAFDIGDYEVREADDGKRIYRHTRMEALYDQSVVTYPAYEDTDAAMENSARSDDPEPPMEPDAADASDDLDTSALADRFRRVRFHMIAADMAATTPEA